MVVERFHIPGKVIVLMDRGYESFNNIAHLQEKEWNFIIRAKESYGMISNLQLPNSEEFDVDTTLTLTRRQTKETLALLSANFIVSVGELKHPLENLSISLDYPVCTARKQTFYYKRFLLD